MEGAEDGGALVLRVLMGLTFKQKAALARHWKVGSNARIINQVLAYTFLAMGLSRLGNLGNILFAEYSVMLLSIEDPFLSVRVEVTCLVSFRLRENLSMRKVELTLSPLRRVSIGPVGIRLTLDESHLFLGVRTHHLLVLRICVSSVLEYRWFETLLLFWQIL